ncbi:hypothetical protein CRE_12413, partial [Caenorhabditis remanei]
ISIFPVIDHFYETIKKFYYVFSWLLFCILPAWYTARNGYENTQDALFIAIVFIVFLLHVIVQVLHVLISLLAIQRVLIYFFQSIEKHLVAVQNKILDNIRYLYIAFLGFDILAVFYGFKCVPCGFTPLVGMVFFCNILLLSSSFLYIPIMISIRKYSYMPTAQKYRPQLYIFLQTCFIVIFKLVCLRRQTFFTRKKLQFYTPVLILSMNAIIEFALAVSLIDIIMIPLMIQFSYLFSNRKNVKTLLSGLKFKRFIRVLFYSNGVSSVHPQISYTQASGS